MGSKSEVIEPKEKLANKVKMVNLFKAALSSLGSLLSTIVRGGGLFLFLSLVRTTLHRLLIKQPHLIQ